MHIYLGNGEIISPLGSNLKENMGALQDDRSGVRLDEELNQFVARIDRKHFADTHPGTDFQGNFLRKLLCTLVARIQEKSDISFESNPDLQVILSTTKGNVGYLKTPPPNEVYLHSESTFLKDQFHLSHLPMVISNACASGLSAIINGARMMRHGYFKHVLIIGYDLVTAFTLKGFKCLYALSDTHCRPYDAQRKGINLGESVAGILLSSDPGVFKDNFSVYHSGGIANDANHISGPSRTGEGLVRAIQTAMNKAAINHSEIGYINAHGTATVYNDEMEAQAFHRTSLAECPTHSLKGYFGHTLGAAGVLETIVGLEGMYAKNLVKSAGYQDHGLTLPLNVLSTNGQPNARYMLKTSSGFGGINAAAIFSPYEG